MKGPGWMTQAATVIAAILLLVTGCAGEQDPRAFTPKLKTVAPIPKLTLAEGSLAVVREQGRVVEILDPAGGSVARISLPEPWFSGLAFSPERDALLFYLPGDGGPEGLHILDFTAGEERILRLESEDAVSSPQGAAWLGSGRVLFAQEYTPDLWIVGTRDGSFKRFRVEPPRAPDWVTLANFFDLTLHGASRDGKYALFYLNNAPKGEAVARLDLHTWSLAIASPKGQKWCFGGFFSYDGERFFTTCAEDELRAGTRTIFMGGNDGSPVEKLVDLPPHTGLSLVAPDGRTLALEEWWPTGGSGPLGILLFDIATKELRPLLKLGGPEDGYLDPVGFTPDGEGLLVRRIDLKDRRFAWQWGVLQRIDLATGRITTIAEDIGDAAVAE